NHRRNGRAIRSRMQLGFGRGTQPSSTNDIEAVRFKQGQKQKAEENDAGQRDRGTNGQRVGLDGRFGSKRQDTSQQFLLRAQDETYSLMPLTRFVRPEILNNNKPEI
ncbi:MAG: hypothetical protein ABUL43_02895, partial [Hyphomicrobium sp.]